MKPIPGDDRASPLLNAAQVEALLEVGNLGVAIMDPDGRVVFVNRRAEEIFGVSARDLVGATCTGRFWDFCEGACPLQGHLDCDLFREGKMEQAIAEHRLPDGREVTVEVSGRVLKDRDGQAIGAVETFSELSRVTGGAGPDAGGAAETADFHGLIGRHPAMRELYEKIRLAAGFDVTVLISGSSGTGKELVARALHDLSARRERPFVAVNCAAIPESLLESTLFGHVRGAFTGAVKDSVGFLGRAEGGTLFLDEIGELSPALQVKLLRFLQQRSYERVGETVTRTADVRVCSATNKDLDTIVRSGTLREDFFYRISVFPLRIPPIAERRSDLPLLVSHFLLRLAEASRRAVPEVDPEVLEAFERHSWPGNVRELENLLEYAFIVSRGGTVRLEHLPPQFLARAREGGADGGPDSAEELRRALEEAAWNRDRAARSLGISRVTLWKRMKAAGIVPPPRAPRGP